MDCIGLIAIHMVTLGAPLKTQPATIKIIAPTVKWNTWEIEVYALEMIKTPRKGAESQVRKVVFTHLAGGGNANFHRLCLQGVSSWRAPVALWGCMQTHQRSAHLVNVSMQKSSEGGTVFSDEAQWERWLWKYVAELTAWTRIIQNVAWIKRF